MECVKVVCESEQTLQNKAKDTGEADQCAISLHFMAVNYFSKVGIYKTCKILLLPMYIKMNNI